MTLSQNSDGCFHPFFIVFSSLFFRFFTLLGLNMLHKRKPIAVK